MMMELATPSTITTPIRALSSEAPIIRPISSNGSSNGHSYNDNGGGPIMISMSREEYTSRTSREIVLQRLSEALLRHSLAKVRSVPYLLHRAHLQIQFII